MGAPWIYPEGNSDCCDAPVYNGVCSKCKEHCESDEETENINNEDRSIGV